MNKVSLREKIARLGDHGSPKVVGDLNGQQVNLVKFQGEFVWHKHDGEDELFLVVLGRFRMEFRDWHVSLEEGEFLIVPRGVGHRPVAARTGRCDIERQAFRQSRQSARETPWNRFRTLGTPCTGREEDA